MRIIPEIHFNGVCDEAIKLYQQVFGCTVKSLLYYHDDLMDEHRIGSFANNSFL